MKYLTLSKKLTYVLSKGTIVQDNNPIDNYSIEEIQEYNKKGWTYHIFTANENEDFDFLKFGQWCKDIKLFIDNVYYSIN